MTGIILTPKKLFKFFEAWNSTNSSATADCIHVDVHVAGIGKEGT
jgi:hypothetical protein